MISSLRSFATRPLAMPLSVFTLALVVHLTALGNGFVGDDPLEIEMNPVINAPFSLNAIFSAEYMSGFQGRFATGHYRPVTLLVQKIEYDLFGPNPLPFHTTVVVLHSSLAALIAAFLSRRCRLGLGAWFAGCLFGVHTALTEAVACSFGLKEVLASLLAFAALYVYSGWSPLRPLGRGARLAGACLLLVGAILSKESSILFFLALPAWDLLHDAPIKDFFRSARARIRPALLHGALFASAVFTALTLRAPVLGSAFRVPKGSPINNPLLEEGGGVRVATALRLVWNYVRLLLAPVGLSHDYSAESIPLARSPLHLDVIAGAVLLAGLAIMVLRAHRLRSPAGIGAIIVAGSYGLISNLAANFGTLFSERFLYLPSVGLALAAAPYLETGIERAAASSRSTARFAAALVPAAVLVVLSILTLARCRVYRDETTLVADSYRRFPLNLAMQKGMVDAYLQRFQLGQARALIENIEARRPDMPFLLEQKGRLALAGGRRDEALTWYERAAQRPEADITTFRIWAEMLVHAGRPQEAIRALSTGLREPTGDLQDRARARELRGALLLESGKKTQALVDLRVACRIDPKLAAAWGDLGKASLMTGQVDEARSAFERALSLQPQNRAFLEPLANLEAKSRNFPAAISYFKRILEIDPDSVAARGSLASCFLASGDRTAARATFEEILGRNPDNRYALASLGSLDAAEGNLEAARAYYQRFLSGKQPEDDLTHQVRERLARLGSVVH